MAAMSNATMWDDLRNIFPSFASHTSKATSELFTERGFEALKNTDQQAINDFFNLSLRVYLQTINVSHAKDTLEENGFGEYFNQPFGAIIQKMTINSVKPISPSYKNLKDGDSPDPFVVRKPSTSERFFRQNFDYQSLITVPDDFQMKQIFISEFGMSEFMGGIMESLQNGYTVQKFENKIEVLGKALSSTTWPLKDTQKLQINFEDMKNPTNDEILNMLLSILNVVDAMLLPPQTDAFNAYGFSSIQDKDRLYMLVKPGWKNKILMVLPQVFHYKESPLGDLKIIEVPNFGNLEYYTDNTFTSKAYPVYDKIGAQIGWSTTENATTSTVDVVYTKDTLENVIGLIADKGLIFESLQNPYTVEPIRNPRGLYTNYWASSPNNTVAVDPVYNLVAFGNFT